MAGHSANIDGGWSGVLSQVKMGKCGISVKLLRIILIGLYAGFSKIVPTLALNLERHVVLV